MVAPAQHVRSVAGELAPHLPAGKPVVLCAKGLEQATGKLLGQVLAETIPHATQAVLSGPSFAADVARGLPAALTLATADEVLGQSLATALGYRILRIYWSSDTVGVQLGGAVKNVLAIAAGIVDGKGLGASAHAALVTRGFAELRRFGAGAGRPPDTLMGLSGLGDLLLTCGSAQSRNMSLGRALGQGQTLAPCSAAGARWRRASIPPPLSPRWRRTRASTCRSARPCQQSSRASSPWTPPSRPCCRGRSGRRGEPGFMRTSR